MIGRSRAPNKASRRRCVAPYSCATNAAVAPRAAPTRRFVDVHHVQPRAEGGRNEDSNLLTLCGAHHRAVHRGELLIERAAEGSFTFRHADGVVYGDPMAPRLIDAHAKVFSTLRHLGFCEGEVTAVLTELRGDAAPEGATVERLLHEALRRIRPKAR